MNNKILLSIVIPAYNEQARLLSTLQTVSDYLAKQPYPWEIIVVANGCTDDTLYIAEEFALKNDSVIVIHEEKAGKGRAVKLGMLAAKGKWRFMCDADLSMPIEELDKFITPELKTQQILIGSREAEGAVRFHEPEHRHRGGRFLNSIIQYFALPNLNDTQCGFKLFKGSVAEDLFKDQLITGWAFDIEILYIARMRKYKIDEIGIDWYYQEQSHISPIKDGIKMIFDILEIRRNALVGNYEKEI